jgi:hypothetical protein
VAGKVEGYQLGLINISDEYESGTPIGLVNISRKGSFHATSWIEQQGGQAMPFVGLRTGAGMAHSIFALGANSFTDQHRSDRLIPTIGAGAHFGILESPLFVETELLFSTVFDLDWPRIAEESGTMQVTRFRTALGWKALSFVNLVGGVSWNLWVDRNHETEFPDLKFRDIIDTPWPSFYAGIQIGK